MSVLLRHGRSDTEGDTGGGLAARLSLPLGLAKALRRAYN
ncbi:MAG: hypothetical protein AVDCRST_MAG01-01-5110 [uncultured Rubrobacteraceae bacterium]|uniref:Uncharacterized protein n=1 Tax=uncultured Rubrobacteraceae bacterium TaxID=349277 RepID=A0A6J4QUE3_9ACTN|nr:MAG: hypothetical protein AVDCRST_MAG01-01-5110 [uncultured Rubrobacteraceae bacterium]